MSERWPQFCRVKITFESLLNNWFISTKTNFMKCFVNWIALNTHVLSNKTQPYRHTQQQRTDSVLFYQPDIGESLRSRGFRVLASQGGTQPRFRIADWPLHPVLPLITWGVRILPLHLNYVAGYTGHFPLRLGTHPQLPLWWQGALALVAPLSKRVQSWFGFILRVQSDNKISWGLLSQGL